MKPREFDELIRQKFDQNEFEYNPAAWGKLETELGKKPARRNIMLWLPFAAITSVASVAASLAMIVTIPALQVHKSTVEAIASVENSVSYHSKDLTENQLSEQVVVNNIPVTIIEKQNLKKNDDKADATAFKSGLLNKEIDAPLVFNSRNKNNPALVTGDILGKRNATKHIYSFAAWNNDNFFNKKTVLSFSGGISYGSQVNGYSIGATGKRMLGSKFYIEGDVAFVKNNTSYKTEYTVQAASKWAVGAKMSSPSSQNSIVATSANSNSVTAFRENNYDLYYAQVTPTIGCNVFKHFSVGMGADMQRLVMAGKPITAADNADNIKEAPSFDFGFVGKTECELTKKIKAGIYYRQGLNNTLNPGSKYLDRSYVQVQLKFSLLKK